MFAISWCKKCYKEIVDSNYNYCPWCGRKIINQREMTAKEFINDGYFKK